MTGFHFEGLLQDSGWMLPAYVSVDSQGKPTRISPTPDEQVTYERINGYALPGLVNAHSHAFQYAMAGWNERHDLTENPDDFWGWRENMYRLALRIDPDQMETIATMLYAELARHGYTAVAEFHYLHHDPTGARYADPAEMGRRLVRAAQRVGIHITLIPILYQQGGFGQPPQPGQRRFISTTVDDYLALLAASEQACATYDRARVGYGVHSLRAVAPTRVATLTRQLSDDRPFHLHIAEQVKEVEASLSYLGQRPVEWLLDHVDLSERFHLVHATHMTAAETEALARTGARVVLCPSTEGNLGDGLFPLATFQAAGGQWSIGTDSHVGLNPFEELRILDYGQRVTTHNRAIYASAQCGDSGLAALRQMVHNGRRAMGQDMQSFFGEGQPLDALVMDANHPVIATRTPEQLTSTIVYASDVSMHLGTLVAGRWVVRKGQYAQSESFGQAFRAAVDRLLEK